RERAVPPRRDEEVLAVGRPEDLVEATAVLSARREPLSAREDTVHGEAIAVEVVARWVEADEVDARDRLLGDTVALRSGAPLERVVQRVEVAALRDRRPLRIDRAVRADDVVLEARGRLDRGAVTEA